MRPGSSSRRGAAVGRAPSVPHRLSPHPSHGRAAGAGSRLQRLRGAGPASASTETGTAQAHAARQPPGSAAPCPADSPIDGLGGRDGPKSTAAAPLRAPASLRRGSLYFRGAWEAGGGTGWLSAAHTRLLSFPARLRLVWLHWHFALFLRQFSGGWPGRGGGT